MVAHDWIGGFDEIELRDQRAQCALFFTSGRRFLDMRWNRRGWGHRSGVKELGQGHVFIQIYMVYMLYILHRSIETFHICTQHDRRCPRLRADPSPGFFARRYLACALSVSTDAHDVPLTTAETTSKSVPASSADVCCESVRPLT